MPRKNGAPWTARVLTIFPEAFPGPLGISLTGKALSDGLWALETVDIRGFASDKHRTVDNSPFGGGPGMVMRPDVVDAAIGAARDPSAPLIYLSPRGRLLTQARVRELADGPGVTLLCGRFEGVDERVLEAHEVEEISLGDFVLSGGETAAIALIEACVRLLPGVVGAAESLDEESFERGLLEYPPLYPAAALAGSGGARRSWFPATTGRSRPGAWARRRKRRGSGGPICGTPM